LILAAHWGTLEREQAVGSLERRLERLEETFCGGIRVAHDVRCVVVGVDRFINVLHLGFWASTPDVLGHRNTLS
jgi:hypothetical protein